MGQLEEQELSPANAIVLFVMLSKIYKMVKKREEKQLSGANNKKVIFGGQPLFTKTSRLDFKSRRYLFFWLKHHS